MKKSTPFNLLIIAAMIHGAGLIAQNNNQAHLQHQIEQSDVITNSDLIAIKDFDETAAIAELKAKGIADSEIKAALRDKKTQHIIKQMGITTNQMVLFPHRSLRTGGCDNVGFDSLNFTNWVGTTGYTTAPNSWTAGIVTAGNNSTVYNSASQHTIHDISGFDPYAINITSGLPEIPVIAPFGGIASTRLGNSSTNYGMEQLKYTINVTSSNALYTFYFAYVVEDPTGHIITDVPSFSVTLHDQNGVLFPGPAGILYSSLTLPCVPDTTIKPFNDPNFGGFAGYYKTWTPMTLDLTPYIGTSVTIVFETKDCNLGGHFGYAYIDMDCFSGVGISEINQNALAVYPNPSNGEFNFNHLQGENTIEIYDVTGRIIYKTITKNYTQSIDLSSHEMGIYFYKVIDKNSKVEQGKIILNK